MSSIELKELILSFTQDIEFEYNGVHGAICPYSRTDIGFAYGDLDKDYESVDTLMNDPVIDGKTLNEVAEDLFIL